MQQLVLAAAQWSPNDVNIHLLLGVLYNVSQDYDSAVESFSKAKDMKLDDYTIWNKVKYSLLIKSCM